MSSLVGRRPSPAMVVAVIALFVALGGVSYGLAVGSIGSREIKNNSVRSVDVRNSEIRSQDVRDRSLLAKDFRAGQLPPGAKGDQGPRGPSDAFSIERSGSGDLPSTAGPTIERLSLATGAYAITARVVINGASGASYRGDCELRAGGSSDKASVSEVAPTGAAGSTPVTLTLLHAFTSPGEAILACTDSDAQPASFSNARITAIQVARIFATQSTP